MSEEASLFLLRDLIAKNPHATAGRLKSLLAEYGIRMTVADISAELSHSDQVTAVRRRDHRVGWKEAAPPPTHEGSGPVEELQPLRYNGPDLWRWQKEALDQWHERGRRGVVEAITGTGKSLLGIKAIEQTVNDGGRALLLVPTLSLLRQWESELHRCLPDLRMAMLGDGKSGTFHDVDVLIASVQSAARRLPHPPGLSLVIADEVHRYGAPFYAKALSSGFERRLGLTGTYERRDDGIRHQLNPYFGGVVYSYRYGQALADGVVAPFHLAMIGTNFTGHERQLFDEAEEQCADARTRLINEYNYPEDWARFFEAVQVGAVDGDIDEVRLCRSYLAGFAEKRRLLAEALHKTQLVAALGGAWAKVRRALVFTETVESAEQLSAYIGLSTPSVALSGGTATSEREDALRGFHSGRIRVLTAPHILDEGLNVPEADLAVVVAASRTRRQMVQRMGRVIRLKKDGRSARIAVIYVSGTGEDPSMGGHTAFLDEVSEHAQSVSWFNEAEVEAIAQWLTM